MKKYIAVRAVLAVWIFIWALFLVRPFFKKDLLKEYSILLRSSAKEKRATTFGAQFYGFLQFCKTSLPPLSTYKIIGLEKQPLDYRRAVYCLYPNIDREGPEFLLVYNVDNFSIDGYAPYKSMGPAGYILRRAD